MKMFGVGSGTPGFSYCNRLLDKEGESNYYVTYEKNNIKYQAFYLNYRYRLLKDGKDGSNGDADYDIWYTMEETMIR